MPSFAVDEKKLPPELQDIVYDYYSLCDVCGMNFINCYTFDANDGLVRVCINKRLVLRDSGSIIRLYTSSYLNNNGEDIRLLPGGVFNPYYNTPPNQFR